MRSEMNLLYRCARQVLTGGERAAIDRLLNQGIIWEELIALGRQHGMIAPLRSALKHTDNSLVSPEALDRLSKEIQSCTVRSMMLTGELSRVTDHLSNLGIRIVAYKGPVLATLLHGNLGQRFFSDLDLFIDKADLPAVVTTLEKLDYTSRKQLHWEHSFVHNDNKTMVDVHWAFTKDIFRFPLTFSGAWQHSRPLRVGTAEIRTFSTVDTLIAQCVNAAKDDWVSLGQIFDIAQLIAIYQDTTDDLLERAASLGCKRILLLGAHLSRQLFGISLPGNMAAAIIKDCMVRQLAFKIVEAFDREASVATSIWGLESFRLQQRENLRDRLPYMRKLLRFAVTPNNEDKAWVRLPALLSGLYILLRPIRLVVKHAHRGRTGRYTGKAVLLK
jgi:hypothetical protein